MVKNVKFDNKMYDVIIKNNLLDEIEHYININKKTLVLTDDLVPNVYYNKILNKCSNAVLYVMKHGEENKTLDTVNSIYNFLLENEFSRDSQIICLGGGIVGDLGGFVAATYKRGIDFVLVPTTTLSMVDSSIGSKVGININGIKNAIGAFYSPSIVLIDPTTLKTLPVRHFNNGLVEALKMGLCLNKELFYLFKKDLSDDILFNIICLSIDTKKKVVEIDPLEQNIRRVLNFGHTIGHAVESISFGELHHGECVAIGMIYSINNQLLKEEVINILSKLNISCSLNINNNLLEGYLKNDKKVINSYINYIVLNDVEDYEIKKYTSLEVLNLIGKE